jgi:hypothetical protein
VFLGVQLISHVMHRIVMTRAAQQVQDRYDVLMFAKDRESARKAAGELVRLVLGPEADELSLQEAMRETCRRIRPSADPREQQRFENEFIELAIWPETSQRVAA